MNTVQRIAKNTTVIFAAEIIRRIISFFYIIYMARYLGAERFGILSFALAFTGIFGIFTDMGLSTVTIREVARDKSLASKYLGNIATIKIILITVTFSLITITINFLGYPDQTIKVVYIIALSVIFSSFNNMFYSIFKAYEKMEYQAFGQILSSFIILLSVLFAISHGFNIIGFALIYLFLNFIIFGYSLAICCWKFVPLKMEIDWSFWKSIIKEALPFGFTTIFYVIYYDIDKVMLSLMVGDTAVGWYAAAYKLVLVLGIVNTALGMSLFPVLSRYFTNNLYNKIIQINEKSFKYLLTFAVPICLGTTILADKIIIFIFGVEYINSIICLRILIWAEFIIMIDIFGNILSSINKQKIPMMQTFICTILNIVLNLILIPYYSYIGAAIATLITHVIAIFILYYYVLKNGYGFSKKFIIKVVSKVIIANILIVPFIFYFKYLSLPLIIVLVAFIYFLIIYLINIFDKTDVKLITSIINIKRG